MYVEEGGNCFTRIENEGQSYLKKSIIYITKNHSYKSSILIEIINASDSTVETSEYLENIYNYVDNLEIFDSTTEPMNEKLSLESDEIDDYLQQHGVLKNYNYSEFNYCCY